MLQSWDDLRFFLAIVRGGSLAEAAKALGVNKSTAFRRIATLEEQLGTTLFEVRGRSYVPTSAAAQLLIEARAIEERVHGLERGLSGSDARLAGPVALTTTTALAAVVLPVHLQAFAGEFPDICVSVMAAERMFRLGAGEADVALRHGPRPTEGDVIAHQLGTVAGAICASRSYLERCARPVSRADLARCVWVGVHEDLSGLPSASFQREIAPNAVVAARFSEPLGQRGAVEAGLGVAALPCFLGDSGRELVRLFEPEPKLETSLWLIWHRELRQSARVRALTEHLKQALQSEKELFAGTASAQRFVA